jgi:hypothetical protein
MAQQWEYKAVPAGTAAAPQFVAQATEEGRHGWELVAVVPVPNGGGQVTLIFQRPVPA